MFSGGWRRIIVLLPAEGQRVALREAERPGLLLPSVIPAYLRPDLSLPDVGGDRDPGVTLHDVGHTVLVDAYEDGVTNLTPVPAVLLNVQHQRVIPSVAWAPVLVARTPQTGKS